jgi:Ca2+-binding RTX toxin-like protein
MECLESRSMLSNNPILSIEENQFFGAGFVPIDVTFRAIFTDTLQAVGEDVIYNWSIDWTNNGSFDAHGSSTDEVQSVNFQIQTPFGQNEAVGDEIVGRINISPRIDPSDPFSSPVYTTPGPQTIRLKVNDTEITTTIDVYQIDLGLFIGDPLGTEDTAIEGSNFDLTLPTHLSDGITFINSWRINWGDVLDNDSGGGQASHIYADDVDVIVTGPSYNITAVAFTNSGAFYAGGTNFMQVVDVPAITTITGAADVNEGSPYTLNLSNIDPGDDGAVGWLIFWEGSGNLSAAELVIGNPPSVQHTYPDGSAIHLIEATAFYDDGDNDATPITVTVNNVAPTANAGGTYLRTDDTPFALNGSATDPAGIQDPLTFSWDLDGDGNFGETGAAAVRGDEVGASPTFNPAGLVGTVNVTLRVNDGDGGIDDDIAQITLPQTDGVFLDEDGVLSVIDTNAANDIVTVTQSGTSISVTIGGETTVFDIADVDEIDVALGSGNDVVVIGSNITVPVTIDGGDGNDFLAGGGGPSTLIGGLGNDILWGAAGDDTLLGGDGNDDLFGGGGNDALVGGFGNDIVTGGSGRDIVIGSQNQDALVGGGGEDILIGGYTAHDNNIAALDNIMAIWGSAASFDSRVATLTSSGGLLQAGVAVFDDDALDLILGGAGRDLVFGDTNPAGDGVIDLLALNLIQDTLIALN